MVQFCDAFAYSSWTYEYEEVGVQWVKKMVFVEQFIKELLLNSLDSNTIFINCGKFPDI